MLRTLLVVAGLAAPCAARGAAAQQATVDHTAAAARGVDTSVEEVVSGGYWTAGDARGGYRVVVVTEGWDVIRRRAFVQWIEEPGERASATVRTTVELTPVSGMFALAEPALSLRGGRWYVSVQGAERPMGDYGRRLSFELGPPGRVRVE